MLIGGGVCATFCAKRVVCFCKSIAIEMGVHRDTFQKYRGQGSNLGRGKNCSHCNLQDFHSLSKGKQVSFVTLHLSHPESDGKSADVGGWGSNRHPDKGCLGLRVLSGF